MFKYAHSTSKVSKDGSLSSPYARRPHIAKLSTDYPGAQHKNMKWRQEYYSLADPHLTHYYRRKLLLSLDGSPKPRIASSLSFRSASSFTGQSSVTSISHTPGNSHTPSPQYTYKVVVKTGSCSNAGTSARAYISLQGAKGALKRRRLQKRSKTSSPFTFQPGSTETFRIRGRDVGNLSHVTLESGGLKKEEAWYVESVTVTNEAGVKWACSCKRWLSLHHADCQLSRTLKARQVQQGTSEEKEDPPTTYLVEVVTGDVRGGGTEASVFLTLTGAKRSTSKTQLHGVFSRNSVVRSEVTCPCDLGPVKTVTIGHDNTGFGADWFLDQVVLHSQDSQQDTLYFCCHQWLSRTQGDGLIERTLTGSTMPPKKHSPQLNYVVSTLTGGMRGAGTCANVFITLHGDKGISEEKRLDNDPANFERGRKDTFLLSCPDLGKLKKVHIRHDSSGLGASWYLEEVTVAVAEGRGNLMKEEELVKFPCGRWLERCDGCGGELQADLFPTTRPKEEKWAERPEHRYQVTTVTGEQVGAGTSANAHLVLCAADGASTAELRLDNGQRSLCAGHTDQFTVSTGSRHYSPVETILVGHDNTGPSPGWMLREVLVKCESTGRSWHFPCHQWLCADRGDGRVQRELHPSATPNTNKTVWDIYVLTSDLRGAGTDANVTIQLHGNKGSSKPFSLGDNIANFEQGEEDVFHSVEVTRDIGVLEGVTVSHDGTGPYPEWHLDHLLLTKTNTSQTYKCQCSGWLSTENGNSVRLAAVAQQPVCPTPQEIPSQDLSTKDNIPATPHRGAVSMPSATTSTPATVEVRGQEDVGVVPMLNGSEISHIHEQDSSITSKYLQQLRYEQRTPTTHSHLEPDSSFLSPPSKSSSFKSSPQQSRTIPYTIHVVAGPHPTGDHTPYLQLVLCGSHGQSPPISLEPLGSRPPTGPETYSVEGQKVGSLQAIRLRLVGGASDTPWLINKITIHTPTTGQTHHFPCGRGLTCGEKDCVLEVVDVLGSSVNTSTALSTPRVPTSELIAYEVKIMTSDKKSAGMSHSVYMLLPGQDASSKTFHFKNSSRSPKFQRGQSDTFQVAVPSQGPFTSIKVAHCPRKKARENGDEDISSSWHLFQVVLTCLVNKTRYHYSCRKWVEPSQSPENLNFKEIPLSKTEHF